MVLRPARGALGGLLPGRPSIRIAIGETATPEDNLKARPAAPPGSDVCILQEGECEWVHD